MSTSDAIAARAARLARQFEDSPAARLLRDLENSPPPEDHGPSRSVGSLRRLPYQSCGALTRRASGGRGMIRTCG
jgi:hypothetical protein